MKEGVSKDNGQMISSVQPESGEQWIVLGIESGPCFQSDTKGLLSKEALTEKQEPRQAPV